MPRTDKANDPRGYNTGNVPPSYGPEDGNLYGDASHREAEDESANVSKNMRRVPQNEAPAHGFSGGRTAQGTMSRSPDAAAQSGKAYDQETIEISTNKVSNLQLGSPDEDHRRAQFLRLGKCQTSWMP